MQQNQIIDNSEKIFSPRVSIVIPVYNGAKYVKDAIESALSQTYSNIEIIVVNDGSNDNGQTEKICKSFGASIRYYYKKNGGVASAVNYGIEQMTGEYFSWLSHDDCYCPEKIQHQIELLSQIEDKKTIVFSPYLEMDENGRSLSVVQLTSGLECVKDLRLQNILSLFHESVHGCTLLIHRDCFKQCGVFREDLMSTQDYECFIRLFRVFPTYYSMYTDVRVRRHSAQGSVSAEHLNNRDEFWRSVLTSLTKEEMAQISGGEAEFLVTVTRIFERNASISQKTLNFLYSKLNNEYGINLKTDCLKPYKEMSQLIYQITSRMEEETNRIIANYEAKLADQQKLIQDYEERLNSNRRSKGIKITTREIVMKAKHYLREFFVGVARWSFRCVRRVCTAIGLKEIIKNSVIFKKLKSRGFIDKLRKGM